MLKKLFAGFSVMAILSMSFSAVPAVMADATSDAYYEAYSFAQEKGMTSMTTFEKFNALGTVSRAQFAKFASKFYENSMNKNEIVNSNCSFTDLSSADQSLVSSIKAACEYGIMKGSNGKAMPNSSLTRGEAMTVISRMLDGDKYNGASPFWADHETNLYNRGVITVTGLGAKVAMRGNVVKMLMNTETSTVDPEEESNECEGLDATEDTELWNLLECGDVTEEEVTEPTEEDYVVEEDKEGTLEVTLSPNTPSPQIGEVVPGAAVGVHVATFEVCAAGADIELRALVLERNLGESNTLDAVALRAKDGMRVTDAKNEKSDATVDLGLKDDMMLKAGSCEELNVVVDVNNAYNTDGTDLAAGDTFRFRVIDAESSAEAMNLSSELSNIHTVATENGSTYSMFEDSAISDVKVGEADATIAEFEFENLDNEDSLWVNTMMFENVGSADLTDAVSNVKMYIDGEFFAEGSVNGDYVSFTNVEGYEVEDNENLDIEITADIDGEVAEDILLTIESELDLTVVDKNGY